ncbi:hypothetical protein CRUP_027140 [Coryphaenoides rupestris]|nr:hypothetical protein CRUP_027140 [Coryphaenoides rupestris]
MGVLQLHNPTHPGTLLQRANHMRLAGTLCDVIITVDGQEFPAHRTVLACTSKMFEILFHRSSLRYALDFLSPKTFQQILEYAYTASLQATAEDLDDLLYAAEILEIEYLEEQCLKVLETIQAEDSEEVGGRHHQHQQHQHNPSSGEHGQGGAGGDQGSRARHWRHVLMSKKHSIQEGRNCASTTPSALHHLALYHMAERSMAEPEPETEPRQEGPPGMEIHMEPLSPRGPPSPASVQNAFVDGLARAVKSECMQVDGPALAPEGCGGHSSGGVDGSGGAADHPPCRDEGPGTPLRGSVITSARELHTGPEECGPTGNSLEPGGFPGGATAAEKHLASLYSSMTGLGHAHGLGHGPAEGGPLPVSVAAPGLGVPLDPRAYGGLLHQGLLHRELLSRLGQFAAGMTRHESQSQAQLCCGECGGSIAATGATAFHLGRRGITSARELHTGPEECGPTGNSLEPGGFPGGATAAEKHLASLYSSMTGLGHAHGLGHGPAEGALPGLLHRELLSRLGQFAAGMTRHESQSQAQLCCGECAMPADGRTTTTTTTYTSISTTTPPPPPPPPSPPPPSPPPP